MTSYLEILTAFTKALSHKIRTPLSVISNELHYLGTKVSKEEIERANSQCKKISDILSAASLIEGDLSFERFNTSELLKSSTSNFELKGDKEKLLKVFHLLAQTLGPIAEEKAFLEGKEIVISYKPSGSNYVDTTISYDTLSALVLENLNIDSIAPPLFDTIILSHGWKISSKIASGKIEITIST